MFAFDNLLSTFQRLDRELAKLNLQQSIIIMGGSAVVSAVHSDRVTVDIDLARPTKMSPEFKHAVDTLAKELELDPDWINTASHIFTQNLPPNFESRTQMIYSGKALSVFRLSNQDLLLTKCLAYFDRKRETDLYDIKKIEPNEKDLVVAQDWMIQHKAVDETTQEVIEFIENLKSHLSNTQKHKKQTSQRDMKLRTHKKRGAK